MVPDACARTARASARAARMSSSGATRSRDAPRAISRCARRIGPRAPWISASTVRGTCAERTVRDASSATSTRRSAPSRPARCWRRMKWCRAPRAAGRRATTTCTSASRTGGDTVMSIRSCCATSRSVLRATSMPRYATSMAPLTGSVRRGPAPSAPSGHAIATCASAPGAAVPFAYAISVLDSTDA